MSIDISNIDRENHDYAIHLATSQGVIAYKNGSFVLRDASFGKYPFEVVDFWRNLSLATEILLKACLLKHHIPFFRKRAQGEYGERVTANTNPWLQSTLEAMQISYVAQINTGTVTTALRSAESELFPHIAIGPERLSLIPKMFYIIIRTRRNRNSHFFFSNQSVIDYSEVEMLFLPLLNLLEELYSLPSVRPCNTTDRTSIFPL
ncbi:MAG: hypothetical protein JW682_06880 [Campylobacterales bacterium]|nr:hypothetical protein [Campylobacterales bacterium]HEO98822.1 hypothetical protein [Campylobacterota bacterium]